MAGFAGPGFASPLGFKLLSLVPPGATIVSGFENYPDVHRHGQLILNTHSNRVDLADWQALSGVDNKRIFDELIEVAASPTPGGLLTEHLLLVSGRFDKEHIFNAAEKNGAERSAYEGETVMLIKPFSREKGEMLDTHWLVIVQNRIAILGTAWMVQQALHRYLNHTDTDAVLMERLSLLDHDVSSWNVLVSQPTASKDILLYSINRWSSLAEDADVLLVGTRFGPKVRVDFSLHADADRGAEFFARKATSFANVFATVWPGKARRRRVGNLALGPDHVQGSIELTKQQSKLWADEAQRSRVSTGE